jgi:hypothetical protein
MQKNNDFDFESILSNKKNVSSQIEKETSKFDDLTALLSKERKIDFELQKQLTSFDKNQVLIKCESINNHDVLIALSKKVIASGKKPIIVLTSINFKTANELFTEAKVDLNKIFLLDTVSKNLVNVPEKNNLKFIDSLRSLTQIQIKVLDFIEENKNVVIIFDSINVLELYHSQRIIYKFVYALTKILHKKKLSGIFILCKEELIPKLGQFFDDIIQIDGVE